MPPVPFMLFDALFVAFSALGASHASDRNYGWAGACFAMAIIQVLNRLSVERGTRQ